MLDKLKMKEKMKPEEQSARLSVLEDLREQAEEKMSGSLKDDMAQVKVVSDSPKGLKEGLEMAEEVIEKQPEVEGMEEVEESEEEDEELLTPDAIDEKIAELLELKAQLER